MSTWVGVDSGPLIALFDASDSYHEVAREFLRNNKKSLFTTSPVITEAVYVLDFNQNAQFDLLEWVGNGALNLLELDGNDILEIAMLMKKYKDRPMDFADGSLVVACQNMKTTEIISVDVDFDIYRFEGKRKFINLLQK